MSDETLHRVEARLMEIQAGIVNPPSHPTLERIADRLAGAVRLAVVIGVIALFLLSATWR